MLQDKEYELSIMNIQLRQTYRSSSTGGHSTHINYKLAKQGFFVIEIDMYRHEVTNDMVTDLSGWS